MMARVGSKAEQFMVSPLVLWLNTFDDFNSVDNVQDLADGILLHKVMHTIDPANCSMTKVHRSVARDQGLRMQNLQLLVERIRNFYHTNMQQLIIGSLPNIVSICNTPESEYSLDQMEKLLILLLGCAVKCEPLIEKMKAMDPIQQQALVTNIKQVTHSTELVCHIDWDDLNEIPKQTLQGLCRTAYSHLQRVAKERDTQYDTIIEVSLEKDYYKQFHNSSMYGHENGLPSRSPSAPIKSSPSINTELLELKKRSRHLQEQLDHKSDLAVDLKEELEQMRAIVQKLQQDKRELAEDAKAACAYRDEIEMLKVQSAKVGKLEADVMKYRQKAEDTEYLKKKIAGLKTENDLTAQTKALLEQKIEALTSRSDALDDLQEHAASIKAQLESLQQEKEMDSEKIEELLARNAHLELEFKHYEERIIQLNMELETTRASALEANSSNEASNLSFEMSEADMTSKAKVLRLEKEAKEMEKSMESFRHAQAKCVELEKINKKLHAQIHTDRKEIIKKREEVEVLKVKASRVDKLQVELNTQRERVEESGRNSSKLKEIKGKYDVILEAKARLEDEVDSLQSKVGLMDHLKDENASLKAQVDSHGTEHEEDQKRIQELLKHNAQLELEKQICSEEVEALKSQLLQLRSKSGPQAPVTLVSPPRYSEAEMASRAKLQRLEKETQEMEKTMEALRHTQAKCSELEKGSKKLMEQTHLDRKKIIKLKEELQSSKAKLERMEKLQIEMKNQEHQLEDIDTAKRKITELKQQNSLLSEARILLQEEMSSLQSKLEKYSSSQADNVALKVRVEAMEAEQQEESLRMQELLQQNVQLELDRDKKNEELKTLNDEILQLKLKEGTDAPDSLRAISPVHKPMSEDDVANRTKLLRLERDNRELERSLDVERQTSQRTSAEMEKMNRKLTATIHADKKEIARLKEELRRERVAQNPVRNKSVSEEPDFDQTKQVQELENKFKEAYSHSLSTKDERIQVLEKRVEEVVNDNTQLREDLATLKKQNEKLKESAGSSPPQSSPGKVSRSHVAMGPVKLKERVTILQEENSQLSNNLLEAKHIIERLESGNQRHVERIGILEKLNSTLDEEKKTLLTRMNELLERNEKLLVKTLETKDVALEDERIFNDRLGELERDKIRLKEQLAAQRRETLAKEMDYWKKSSNKSKNILKKGFKKLKGKIQGRTHTFDYPESGPSLGIAGSGHTIGASVGSAGSGGLPFHIQDDGSMSSSRSISSSNSKQSDEQEEEGDPTSVVDGVGGFIPRAATFDGSPFLRQRRKGNPLTLPGVGTVKLRHGAEHPQYTVGVPNTDPSNIPDDLMSLEDFLAESENTPNRRRVMELNRASLVIGTPPTTPRNSLLLTTSNSQMFDLQEFLSKVDPYDSRSKRGTIHEVEENDPDHIFIEEQKAEHKASQQSISQHSKSSNSLHSAPSLSSMSRDNQEQVISVIANPAATVLAANMNSNNSNSGQEFYLHAETISDGSQTDDRKNDMGVSGGVENSSLDKPGSLSSLDASTLSSSQNSSNSNWERHSAVSERDRTGSDGRHYNKRYFNKERALPKKGFHRSSSNILDVPADKLSKPPLVKKKGHESATDLYSGGGRRSKFNPKFLDLSDLTDLRRLGEKFSIKGGKVTAISAPGMGNAKTGPIRVPNSSGAKKSPFSIINSVVKKTVQNHPDKNSDQNSDEMLTLEDFLASDCLSEQQSISPSHQSNKAPPTSPSLDEEDWLEFGSV